MKVLAFVLFLTIAHTCYGAEWYEELFKSASFEQYQDSLSSEDYFNLNSLSKEKLINGLEGKIPSAPVLVLEPVQQKCQFRIYNYIGQVLNTYSRCIEVGTTETWIKDKVYDIKRHGAELCTQVQSDEKFKNGNFSIIAFSDGGMLARYLIEYCQFEQPIRNVVTMGAPLNGVSGLSHQKRSSLLGSIVDWFVDKLISYEFMDRVIHSADYWRDPRNHDGFLAHSKFLAEANNEVDFDEERKDAWIHINHALFVQWGEDQTLIPRESAHWAVYDEHFEVVERHSTILFQEDLLGLQSLEEEDRTTYITFPGDHLEFNFTQINDHVMPVLRL